MIEVRNNIDFNDQLELLLCKYESDDLEFKSAKGGFPGTFWDTYSAFANTDGGVIVLGVAEKHNKFFLDGLTDDQMLKYKRDFWNNVNNRSTINCNLLTSKDVEEADYKGYKFMLFHVPRASREQRPVYRTSSPFGNTFKRDFEGDYRCSDAEVRRMFADADDKNPFDSRILTGYSIDDIDKEAIVRYRQLFKLSHPDHPWLALNDLDLLKKLGGYRIDRATGKEGFTVAGLLMFGKSDSITDNECTPHFFPDYQEHMTEDEDVRWTNRICADGTWEANLFNFYQRILPRLQSLLPKPFKIESNIRREETPAHIAVREALINLCVHADYTINASLLVKLESHRIIFSNPGTMLVSKDQYYTGGESVCRNKSLQKMFAMLGVAEKAGSGTDKILKGWKESNWRSPDIEERLQPDKVVLVMPMESFLSEDTKEQLTEKFGAFVDSFDHNVLSVLALASEEKFVTNSRLRYSLNLHKSEISEILKLMTQRGLLISEGHGRGMRYYLPEGQKDILQSKTSTDANSASSDANSASSDVNSASSDTNSASSDTNSASSDANSASLEGKVARSRKKRLTKDELRALIIEICTDWVTIEEIVERCGKSHSYVRNVVIPYLLAEKSIVMMFPGTPRTPKQKYRAKE